VLAKHELLRGTWNELFTFIDIYVKSNDVNERQVNFQQKFICMILVQLKIK